MQDTQYSKAYDEYLKKYSNYMNNVNNSNRAYQTNTDQALINEVINIKWLIIGISLGIVIGLLICQKK